MNIITAFITNSQSTKLVQPGKRPLNHPTEYTQPAAVFGSAFGQNRFYTQLTQSISMGLTVIGSIALNTIRSLTRTAYLAGNRRYRFNQRQKLSHIMAVGPGELHRQWDPVGIGDEVMFRARFPSIRRIWARFRPPKTARTEAESTTAREKSILSFSRSFLSRMRCILSQTPAFCQSRSLRQQVIPEPQPISLGKCCQGIPVLRTKMIPVRTFRSSMGGLPPFGRGGRFGMIGSMSFHNSSSINGLAMIWSSVTFYCISAFSTHILSAKPPSKF